MKPSSLLLLSLLAVAAAVIVYGLGVWNGHLLDLRAMSAICPGRPLAHRRPYSSGAFPLSYRCLWRDGTSKELVPGYVNPLIVAFLAAAVGSTVSAAVVVLRRRPPA